jgi:hypothetical protein
MKSEGVYDLTIKKNTVMVVTDGTAVLGLGILAPRQRYRLWKAKPCSLKDLEVSMPPHFKNESQTNCRGDNLSLDLVGDLENIFLLFEIESG